MKARRRLLISALCVLVFIAAVVAVVVLRKKAAPEAARLLPEADAVLYIDFATVRSLTSFDQQPLPQLAAGYDEFVKQTGFSFERDLDEAAMAIHRGPTHGSTRYTEILVGHYDQTKLAAYLRPRARNVETYRGVEVFSVPIEDRTVRIAMLAIDTVAVSNVESTDAIHGIIDRFKKVALPFGGPSLVQLYYPRVPIASLMWTIAHIPAQAPPARGKPAAPPSFTLPGGVDVGLPGQSDVVVSLRMLSTIHVRAEFFTQSNDAARNFTEQTNSFLALFRSLQANATPAANDQDVKTVFDSIKITQKDERAEVTATIPPTFLRKLVREPASNAVQGAPATPDTKPRETPAKK